MEARIRGSNMMKMCISCKVVMVYVHPYDVAMCARCKGKRGETVVRYV